MGNDNYANHYLKGLIKLGMMNDFYKNILNVVRLKRTIRYHGSMTNLLLMMTNLSRGNASNQDLVVRMLNEHSYTIEPSDNTPLEMSTPISYFSQNSTVNVELKSKNENLQLIHCTAKIRPVIYGVIMFYVFTITLYCFSAKNGVTTTGIVGWTIFWTLMLLLGNYYWSQKEKYVIGEFKTALYILMKTS